MDLAGETEENWRGGRPPVSLGTGGRRRVFETIPCTEIRITCGAGRGNGDAEPAGQFH